MFLGIPYPLTISQHESRAVMNQKYCNVKQINNRSVTLMNNSFPLFKIIKKECITLFNTTIQIKLMAVAEQVTYKLEYELRSCPATLPAFRDHL